MDKRRFEMTGDAAPHALVSKLDIVASAMAEMGIDEAFNAFSDPSRFEALIARTDADVRRRPVDPQAAMTAITWDVSAKLRGRMRQFRLQADAISRPSSARYLIRARSYDSTLDFKFKIHSPEQTEVTLHIAVAPKSVSARIMLHSLRLAKHRLRRKCERGLRRYLKFAKAS